VLGFKLRKDSFRIECAIPKEWDGFKLRYRYHTSNYEITVENPHHISSGHPSINLDGVEFEGLDIPLINDGQTHTVHIKISLVVE
jgi:cellobiose phosphorylase